VIKLVEENNSFSPGKSGKMNSENSRNHAQLVDIIMYVATSQDSFISASLGNCVASSGSKVYLPFCIIIKWMGIVAESTNFCLLFDSYYVGVLLGCII